MARHTGPKARVNRALGTMVYEESGARRAADRRQQPPGMHVRRRKPSVFGQALIEKQKIKHYYGMRERQLRRMVDVARRRPGDTGAELLALCERRLDNIVRRAGFTLTRPQARQGIVHGHFQVNGSTVDKPAYLVEAGDVIEVRDRPNLRNLYRPILESQSAEPLAWITVEAEPLRATVTALPGPEDVSLPVEVNRVLETMR